VSLVEFIEPFFVQPKGAIPVADALDQAADGVQLFLSPPVGRRSAAEVRSRRSRRMRRFPDSLSFWSDEVPGS